MTEKSICARLVALIKARAISDSDRERAALFTLDAVANIIAGCNSRQGRKLLNWWSDQELHGRANRATPSRESFLAGCLCHILEVDDLHRASVVHPGCVVVPPAFAYAGDDGKTALDAVILGFEAATRVGMAVGPAHYRIWHNTATCGPFGATFATARLLGLNEDQINHALGNAGTQAAGLWQFLDTGAESKHLHAGHAAQAGAQAAELAKHGFTGAPAIFEGDRGFFAAMCPDGDPERMLTDSDAPWQIHLTSIKPWPSCRHTHPAIDAAQELRNALVADGVDATQVQSIDVEAYQAALDLCDRPSVETAYEAKFSLQHCVAAALRFDRVDFEAFDGDAREALADTRKTVSVSVDDGFGAAYPRNWGSRVAIRLPDGSRRSAVRRDARGDPEAPLDRDAMIDKATSLMRHGGLDDPSPLIDAVLAMADGGKPPPLTSWISEAAIAY